MKTVSLPIAGREVNLDHAQLPATYEAARTALKTCLDLDECKGWSDKAAAMAAYARMVHRPDLEEIAQRIRDQAFRRIGELHRATPSEITGRPSKSLRTGTETFHTTKQRNLSATDLTPDQIQTARDIASIPVSDFEAMVEASPPATVVELARHARDSRRRAQHDESRRIMFTAAGPLPIALANCTRTLRSCDPETAWRGNPRARAQMMREARFMNRWLTRFLEFGQEG
jgi:hypothetical protein